MDRFTANHLNTWLNEHVSERERESTLDAILALVHEYPCLPETRTWSEIRDLATR